MSACYCVGDGKGGTCTNCPARRTGDRLPPYVPERGRYGFTPKPVTEEDIRRIIREELEKHGKQ